MGVDDAVPLLLGHVEQHAFAQDAGHADGTVEAAELVDRGLHEPLAGLHRRDVVGNGDRGATGRLDLRRDRLSDLARQLRPVHAHAVVVDDDACAFGGAGQRDCAADAAPGTGDSNDFSVQKSHAAEHI